MQIEITPEYLSSQGLSTTFPKRFWGKINKNGPVVRDELGPCWVWTAARTKDGYGIIGNGGRGNGNIIASRAAWILNIGEIPKGQLVLHKCDNEPCCNPAHLFLGTDKDNSEDVHRKIVSGIRETYGSGKLTPKIVREIRELAASGMVQRRIAERFSLCYHSVCDIVNRRRWKHI